MAFFVNCYLLLLLHCIEKYRYEPQDFPDSILYPFSKTTQMPLYPMAIESHIAIGVGNKPKKTNDSANLMEFLFCRCTRANLLHLSFN